MMLTTTFMGIELRNPIVVGASHLTGTIRKLKACEKAGASAVVVRTIFEEQVRADSRLLAAGMKSPSSSDAVLEELSTNHTLDEYLTLIEEAVKGLEIPVIASIHCRSPRGWEEYAKRIEDLGVRAIELNLFELGSSPDRSGAQIEKSYFDIARRVRRSVKLPLA
ncbi:MAG TPA: dihydroorotate oxidase, partial [Spirochaetia bacterium]|nr:dihydroorotate oxidase [Spirochaetia bacterium]